MSTFRITTNGMFRNYRTNLSKNNKRLNDTMTTVQTERKFNTYAEDPAAASKAFRLRRSYWLTEDQIDNNNYIISKYENAYTAMGAVVDGDTEHPGLDGLLASIEGISDTAGASRNALGRQLIATSESIVAMMNVKYEDDFIFAGADGENLPFQWDEHGTLRYRGIDVSTPATTFKSSDFGVSQEILRMEKPLTQTEYDAAFAAGTVTDADYAAYKTNYQKRTGYTAFEDAQNDYAKLAGYNEAKAAYETEHPGYSFEDAVKLNDMANETTYVDIGLGMKEDQNGELIRGSAFNSAISGLKFLGYGEDKNLAVVIREIGQILVNADAESGAYMRGSVDQDRMNELLNSLHDCVRSSQGQHVQLSADAKYLRTNLDQLQTNKNELNTQIMDTESIDPAEAITEMSWAQYCYNAALRIGTNILSQSLIDYMS